MDYTLHQLRVFLKVAELQSITKASEELHLTQPAVSIQLKKLQDQFDIPLVEVIGRKLYVTEFGKEIAEASKKILEQVHEIGYKTKAFKGHLVGQLRVSVVSTAKYVMPYFLSDFLKKYPEVDLVMDVTNKSKVVKSLEKNEVDFAMVSVLPENLMLDNIELMENKLVFVGSANNRLKAKKVTLKQLEKLPLIFRERGSATRQAMERFILSQKIPNRKKLELTSNEAVKQAVIAGLGYSIMPMIGIKNEVKKGDLIIYDVKGLPISTMWNLVWLKDKKFSPIASAYLNYLETNKEGIIQEKF
ncbi:LysR family transcriptional regulator [Flexithrix dorotheae]|uniref:LysR family transcriptional regulator n=1 Tax=Flexithrix dorotheae TaxID=70993 RepID=UPI00037AED6F|nr:LysR family transcriptional regulator [Flexithrix dorotheae]